jgi:hypothetical protein
MSAFYRGALCNNHIKENHIRLEILVAVTVKPGLFCFVVPFSFVERQKFQKLSIRQMFHLKTGRGTVNKYITQE